MPRSHRHYLPGYFWHITHRCHKQEFLLKFARDRRCWRYWLYEARKRYGLCVLNYIVTSNHIHLLVRDRGEGEIPLSMQLIAGRMAQTYNQRKGRKGAFWEDRYHATVVETGEHLALCLAYIDLNMVRAGVVGHPAEWEPCGYSEIQFPPSRFRIIDTTALTEALGTGNLEDLRRHHHARVEEALKTGIGLRDERWTRSLAVGSEDFVKRVQQQLCDFTGSREVEVGKDLACLREASVAYTATFVPEMEPSS